MLKSILAAATISLATAAFSPSFADEMAPVKCDTATMGMVNDAMKADTDPKMKPAVDSAMKHMAMADDAMKANKMDDCSAQIGMAKKDMMMK